jgi:hypothetical protein
MEASVAVKVTVVAPIGNTVGASSVIVGAESTLSEAIAAAKKATIAASVAAVPSASVAATVIDAGAVTTGAVWSVTVTTAEAVPLSMEESVLVKVTVVAPTGNTVGASSVIVGAESTLSEAVAAAKKATIAASVAAVPSASVAATVIGAGAVTTGAV